jgi:hypothetical protein
VHIPDAFVTQLPLPGYVSRTCLLVVAFLRIIRPEHQTQRSLKLYGTDMSVVKQVSRKGGCKGIVEKLLLNAPSPGGLK